MSQFFVTERAKVKDGVIVGWVPCKGHATQFWADEWARSAAASDHKTYRVVRYVREEKDNEP